MLCSSASHVVTLNFDDCSHWISTFGNSEYNLRKVVVSESAGRYRLGRNLSAVAKDEEPVKVFQTL